MKRNFGFVRAMMTLSAVWISQATYAGNTEWERQVKKECSIYGSVLGPNILEARKEGLTKEAFRTTVEASMNDKSDKVMVKVIFRSIDAVYSPFIMTKLAASEKVQSICIDEKLKDDPTGAKVKAKEEAARHAKEKEEAARQARDEQINKAKEENEEAAKEALAIYNDLDLIKRETTNEVNKASYLPTEQERSNAVAEAEKRGEEKKKQLLAKRAQYMSERLAAKRALPESAGKTDSQLRDEIRSEDSLAKEQRAAIAAKEKEEARKQAAAERKKAQEEEARLRQEKYEQEQAERMRKREQELRALTGR